MKKINLIEWLFRDSHEKQSPQRFARYAAMLILLLTLGVGQMWGAWTGNAGICVNGTWYKASSDIDGGNWLSDKSTINGTDLGAITSLELGGQYDNYDGGQDDNCSWNSNNGIWITITTNSGTQIDNFKLSCYRDGKSGDNNVWKTTGTTGECGDGSSWAAYAVDISGYEAGIYKLKVHWFSASGVALPSSGDDVATFTIAPVVTFKANGGTGSDYTQTVTYNTNTALTANTFTKTGYDFAGWATSADGNVAYANQGNVKLTAHTNLFAKWTAKTTTVNLNKNAPAGQTVSGDASVTATYDAALPSFTALTCTGGYSLTGYWTAATGVATKVINADGTYADNSGIWDRTDGATLNLYARWSADPGVSLAAAKTSGINVGETVRLTATGSNASSITKYVFYEGATPIHTETTSSGTATFDYVPAVAGSKTMSVVMYYNGASNDTETSNNVVLTLNVPSVSSLTEANTTTEMWIGVDATSALTFTAASSNVSSGASVTWSASDASSGTFNVTSSSYSGATITYTPASTGAKTITVTMSIGGNNYTHTYNLTVYERWNIYVQNNCGWANGIALYFYGSSTPAAWPGVQGTGTGCEEYAPGKKWYKVTLDSKYTKFILDNNVNGGTGEEKLVDNVAVNKATYAADTYWDFAWSSGDGPKYYTLHSVSPSVPTVSITSYEVISSTQIKLTGTISNYGSDGSSAASDMKEVGFYCGGTKHSTTHTSSSTFTKVITGLSAGTEYSFKAYAVNVKGEGLSSAQAVTTRAGGTYTIKVRTAVGATAPKLYAWTPADANDGVLEKNATYGSGAAMTAAITGTVYKWWSYDVDKTYNYYIIYETGDGNKTNDISAPQAATCYWYNSSNAQASRYGTMDCPHANPQLYIETTAGGGEYDYYEMTNTSGTLSKSLTLTAKSTYNFKIFYNGEYFGKGSAKATRASNGVDDLSAAVDDYVQIETDAAGSYTFEFTTGGKDLTVTYPDAHKITYGIGAINGSNAAIGATSSPSFTSGDYVLDATAVTFTKGTTKNGYHWEGWYSNTAGTGDAWSTTDANWTSAASTRSADIKVYACYSYNNYTITYHLDGGTNDGDNPSGFTVVTPTITLKAPSKTGYTFDGWYTDEDKTVSGNTIPVGTYANKEFWAKWTAKDYTITLNQNGATTESDPTSLTATYDAKANGASDVFTLTNPERTGYTFRGWNTEADTSGTIIVTWAKYYEWNTAYVDDDGRWIHDGDVEVFAMWKSNEYTVTFDYDETGYGSAGSGVKTSVTATYGKAMPTMGTAPTPAAGYKFMGYFTEANGGGYQYYNADGTSAHAWDIASASTLHAHFQKTVISTLEHPASIAKGDVVTVDVNPVLNQTGATDYMDICWSLLYDNDNPVESGVAIERYATLEKPNQVRFTLTGLSAGYYKVKAVLKANASSFVACDAGTELSTLKSDLRIAGNSNVTILYQDASGNTIHENGFVEVASGETVEVTAPEIIGYSFNEWVLGDVLATEDELTDNPITISAEYDGHLTAKYTRKNTIYFKNTLNWPAVYVNLLDAGYWNENGSGNNGHSNRNLEMTRLGESDIWYYEYDGKTANAYVSFTSVVQNGDGSGARNFWGSDDSDTKVKVVYPTRPNYDANERTAYGFNVNTPMFVPLAGQTAKEMNVNAGGRAYYYNQGYWTKYEPVSKETGYTLKIFNKKNNAAEPDAGNAPVLVKTVPFVFDGDMTFPVSVTVDLEAGKWYGFKLYRDKGNEGDALSWYGNSGNMSNQHSGDFSKGETAWEFKTTLTENCGLKTNSAGDYVFTLTYGKEAYADSMQYLIGVHYPEATGDYRLVYSDDNRTGILSTTIPFNSEHDTVSFFINKDANPVLKMQKCEVSYSDETSTVAWTDTVADFFSGGLPSSITEKGVYYFCINKNPETGKKELGDTKLYEGNFYIRTDGATPSKWDNFRQNNHLMAYSDYADEHEDFTHSYTQWYDLTNRKNLKFTVANDYSVSISDTLTREALSGQWTNIDDYIDENGDLSRQANVRFMYNSKTNAISRAYIDGAYADGGNFLKIFARTQDSIYAAAEGGDPLTEITFTDNGNWLYEQTVFAQPGARYKLRSLFGTTDGGKQVITQFFKGGAGSTAADSATMIGGDGSSRMQIRLLYDFKTNRVVTAYQPSGTIDESVEIHADIMFMREHQEDIEQITFAEGKSISEIENIYCGLRFNKWTLNNKSKEDGHATLSPLLSRYERDIFYVSFPYDVRLSDVIGFGTYGQHWIVEYYDGAARAKNGFWIDSDSYWKFVTPSMKDTFTLKAGTGYIVALDLDELYYISDEVHASIWDNTDITNLELLFPGKVSSISNVDVTYNMPSHECTINRGTTAGNRTIKDSHWNVLGVPTFKNITGQASGDPDAGVGSGEIVFANTAWVKDSLKLKFIYDGNLADNSLTPKAVKDFEFKAMHAYVVQYCGDVTFTTSATPAPASVAARTYAEKPIDVDFRLELSKNGVVEDQTFVSMTNDEEASADFVFGEDLSKEFNKNKANIYTMVTSMLEGKVTITETAGNTLPMSDQTTIVPVGVKIAADGEYTFSIPEGTYGVGITLIDNEAGARVNLGLMDYTVTLAAGQIDDRFVLEISPISQISTDVEAVTGDGLQVTGARKIMIDGLLYIVKDGKVFDAQGKRLQ